MDRPEFTTAFTGFVGALLALVWFAGLIGSLVMWGQCSGKSMEQDAKLFMLFGWLFGGGLAALIGLHIAGNVIEMGTAALRVIFPRSDA